MRILGRLGVVVTVGALVVAPGTASADQRKRKPKPAVAAPEPEVAPTPPPAQDDAPWSKGVTDEQKATAQARLEEGNALFLAAKHGEALAKYQAALQSWDHPAIRFNVVRALINLERPAEAYDNLELALEYGRAPLEDQVFQEAENYRLLLLGQIAELEVSCTEAGATVTLDGQELTTCPGTKSMRVLPGKHVVLARKPGYVTLTRDVVALPGKKESVPVILISVKSAMKLERRWATWKPWAVAGGGVALAGVGFLVQLAAQSNMDQYDAELRRECTAGCLPDDLPQSTRDLESRALLENKIAVGTMIAGGLVAAAGLTMVILNAPREVLPEDATADPGTQLVPTVEPGVAGMALVGSF